MAVGDNPGDGPMNEIYRKQRMALVDADRVAREAGYKSPLRRLLGRLRPRRQEPGGDPQSNYGTSYDPGH